MMTKKRKTMKTRGDRISAVAKKFQAKGGEWTPAWNAARKLVLDAEKLSSTDDEILAVVSTIMGALGMTGVPSEAQLDAAREALAKLVETVNKPVTATEGDAVAASRSRADGLQLAVIASGSMQGTKILLRTELTSAGAVANAAGPSKADLALEFSHTNIERAMGWIRRNLDCTGQNYDTIFHKAVELSRAAQ